MNIAVLVSGGGTNLQALLDAQARGEILPFAAVLPHLREAQEKADWVRASRTYVEELAARADVTGIVLAETPWMEAKIPA